MTAALDMKLASALIDLPNDTNRRVVCPLCSPSRKKKRDKTLSLKRDGEAVVWNCWHCGEAGRYSVVKPRQPAIEKQPAKKALSGKAIEFLNGRGISEDTARRYGVHTTEAYFRKAGGQKEAIGFPYTNHGETYATKLRCLEAKDFSSVGAAQSFFGLPQVGDLDRLIITEGEVDALSVAEAGIPNAIAVPNGAPDRVPHPVDNPEEDRKFRFLWNAREIIEQADQIYLAGDADRPGEILMEELSRRIGRHKCWRVKWPAGCKDANDVLVEQGADAVALAIENAERFPVAGLYEADKFIAEVEELYRDGKGKGHSTGYLTLDEVYTVVLGHLTVVTGIPSSGKSELIDQVMVNLSERHGWKHAVCSFENEPRYHIAKLAQKHTGKHFFPGSVERMSKAEMQASAQWVGEHFYFLHQTDGTLCDVDSIIERLKVAVVRYGIRTAIIDPANYLDRPSDMSETQWVSDMLTKLRLFAQAHEVHVWLVAHPAKMQRDGGFVPVPKGYDISGSANYINKCDFGLTVHRDPDEPALVQVHCWKCRFVWAGKMGETSLVYSLVSTCYSDAQPQTSEGWGG